MPAKTSFALPSRTPFFSLLGTPKLSSKSVQTQGVTPVRSSRSNRSSRSKPLTLMSGVWFKPMSDLNPIAKRIVTVDCMLTLLVPRNLRGIRSPVKLAPIEFFEDRRVKLRSDAKIDVRTLDRACTTLGDLIHLLENHELP